MFEILGSSDTIINPQITAAVHDFLFNAIQLAILTILPAIGYGVKLWISSMKTGWKKAFAERMVKVAQQTITGDGAKFTFVSDKISEHFPRLSQDEIQHLIEEAVHNIAPANTVTVTATATAPAQVDPNALPSAPAAAPSATATATAPAAEKGPSAFRVGGFSS